LFRVLAPFPSRNAGKVLITGSSAGFIPGSFQAVCNGTKAFLDSFSFALREELRDAKVTVTCLMPGATKTEFFERADMMDTSVGAAEKRCRRGRQDGFRKRVANFWVAAVSRLPRRQTHVLTWPLAAVFGFIVQPATRFFFKPMVTREAARRYGIGPALCLAPLLAGLSGFACVRSKGPQRHRSSQATRHDRPAIFLWVQRSDEYPD
jgi:short-subunit dehydrogenase